METEDRCGTGRASSGEPPFPGRILGERFELEQLVGRSGLGSTWRARDLSTKKLCLVRVGDGSEAHLSTLARVFRREAEASANVRSEHVLRILDQGDCTGYPFIAEELLIGETLQQRVSHTGSLPPATVLQYVAETADALEQAHRAGIVHGALAPELLFLARSSGRDIVKLRGFGSDAHRGRIDPSESGHPATSFCTSPEVVRGGNPNKGSDLWSLAMLATYALTGKPPLEAKSPTGTVVEVRTSIIDRQWLASVLPPAVADWASRALGNGAGARYGSATELTLGLAEALGMRTPLVPGSVPPSSAPARMAAPLTNAWAGRDLEHARERGHHHSPVPSRPSQLRLTSNGPRPLPAASEADRPTPVPAFKRTMVGMGSPTPPAMDAGSSGSRTLRGMAAVDSQPPVPSGANFGRTMLGMSGLPPHKTVLGVGSGRPEAKASDVGDYSVSRPTTRSKTMVGVGAGVRVPAAAPSNAVLGSGQEQGLPIQKRLGRTFVGLGDHRSASAHVTEGRAFHPIEATPPFTMGAGGTNGMHGGPPRPAGAPAFFVPRQSTLLGVGLDDAAQVEAARANDRARRSSAPPGPRAVGGSLPPSGHATEGGTDPRDHSAAPPESGGPVTTLKPASSSRPPAASNAPGGAAAAVPAPREAGGETLSGLLDPEPEDRPASGKSSGRQFELPSQSGVAEASDTDAESASAAPASVVGYADQVRRRQRLLIAVVVSVVVSMLLLLILALALQPKNPPVEQPAEASPSKGVEMVSPETTVPSDASVRPRGTDTPVLGRWHNQPASTEAPEVPSQQFGPSESRQSPSASQRDAQPSRDTGAIAPSPARERSTAPAGAQRRSSVAPSSAHRSSADGYGI